MKLPNLCNSMTVGCLRYVQSIHEAEEVKNPDALVRNLIPALERWRYAWLGREQLGKLRADPFYYYLVARTRYYDEVFLDAVRSGVKQIINVGSGSDTRAHRFAKILRRDRVKVLECDQPVAIIAKQRLAKRFRLIDHVVYLPLDLNQDEWPDFTCLLEVSASAKSLVVMEGVSPYVDAGAFGRFLSMLADKLAQDSRIAYDFKLSGVDDVFGSGGSIQRPFRLPNKSIEVSAFHATRGLLVEHFELSSELSIRILPCLAETNAPLFCSDGLVRLITRGFETNENGPSNGENVEIRD